MLHSSRKRYRFDEHQSTNQAYSTIWINLSQLEWKSKVFKFYPFAIDIELLSFAMIRPYYQNRKLSML